jgi:H/ACA ribonucleoprotein complex subunit 3
MEPVCPKCSEKTFSPRPPKFSPEDAYGDYRRKAKRKGLEDKGLV